METLVFWALPVLMALTGTNKPLLTGWRMFLCAVTALYAGVWSAPAWSGLLDFLPPELEPYKLGAAVLIGCAALFALLWRIARAINPADDENFIFPVVPAKILNILFRFGFGVCVATLIFTFCCTTPLRLMTRHQGDGFEAKATPALLRITGFADLLSRSKPEEKRADALKKFWYAPPKPAVKEPKKPAPAQVEAGAEKANGN